MGQRAVAPTRPIWIGLTALALVLFPFPIIIYGRTPPTGTLDHWVVVPLFAVVVVALCLALPALVRTAGPGIFMWSAFAALMTVAFAVHPSPHGLLIMVGIWGVVALAAGIGTMDGEVPGLPVGLLMWAALIESVWALAQRVNGDNLGLGRLGESDFPFRAIGTGLAPSGSLAHPYYIAALALVAAGVLVWKALIDARPMRWAGAVALAVAPVGLTYSRSAAIGGLCLGGCAFVAALRHPKRLPALGVVVALALGVGVPGAVWPQGWLARTQKITSGGDVTTERTTLQHAAVHLIHEHPIIGVGPGRYQASLQHELRLPNSAVTSTALRPVHDEPLLVGAEAGVGALALLVAFLVIIGWRALRTGALSFGVYLALLPYWIFDRLPTDHPQGALITGLWLGFLEIQARHHPATGNSFFRSLISSRKRAAYSKRRSPAASCISSSSV